MSRHTDPRVAPHGRMRHAGMAGVGLAIMLVSSACASESASEWTYAPLADAGDETAQAEAEASPAPTPAPTAVERDIPLQPPAGNTIPRFVEPERVDRPDAGDAIPAPIEIDPEAVTSAASPPAATATATMAPSPRSEPTASANTTEPTTEPTEDTAPDGSAEEVITIELVAQGSAFDADELTVSAGASVRLTLENRDPIPHNFAVYLTDAADESVFVGETFSGPGASRTYEFTAPTEPGEYFFRCDVHPQLMTGTLLVE